LALFQKQIKWMIVIQSAAAQQIGRLHPMPLPQNLIKRPLDCAGS